MEKESLISSRFAPEKSAPIFFAGRKEEITEFFITLKDFQQFYDCACPKHIHILKGEVGIGKTSFMLKIKKEVQDEFPSFIPIYISMDTFIENPEQFYQLFLAEVEGAINASIIRREIFFNFFKDGYKENKFPESIEKILNSMDFDNTPTFIRNFFKTIEGFYQDPTQLKEFLIFLNLILDHCELFGLWILDHFGELRGDPQFLEVIADALHEMEKFRKRFFIVLVIENSDYSTLIESFEYQAGSFLTNLIERHNLISIESNRGISAQLDMIQKYTNRNELPIVNISIQNCIGQIIETIKGRYGDHLISHFSYSSPVETLEYFYECAGSLAKLALSEIKEPYAHKKVETILMKLHKQYSLEYMITLFKKLLLCIDEHLSDKKIIVFWESFENIIDAKTSKFSTKFAKNLRGKRGDNLIYKNEECSVSIPFFFLFHFIETITGVTSNIKFIFVTSFTTQKLEHMAEDYKIAKLFAKSPTKELAPLLKQDAIHMVREIAARSGVAIEEEVALEIYSRIGGNPVKLHFMGNYLLGKMEKELTPDDRENAEKYFLTIWSEGADYSTVLTKGPDQRMRILLDHELLRKIGPQTMDDLYKKILIEIRTRIERNILEVLCEKSMPVIAIKTELEKNYPNLSGLNEKEILEYLEKIQSIGLVNKINNKWQIAHSLLKNFLSDLFQKKKEVIQNTNPEPILQQKVQTKHRMHVPKNLLKTRRLTPTAGPASMEGFDTDKIKFHFLQQALGYIKLEGLPSRSFLLSLGKHTSLKAGTKNYKTAINLIHEILKILVKDLELDLDLGQVLSIAKENLASSKKDGVPNLCFAIEHTLFGESSIDQAIELKDHQLISKIYFYKHHFSAKSEYLKKAIDSFFDWFLEDFTNKSLMKYSARLEKAVDSCEPRSKLKLTTILTNINRLIKIELNDDKRTIEAELSHMSPLKTVEEFHPYLIRYFKKLILSNHLSNNIAISLLGIFGHLFDDESLDISIEFITKYESNRAIIALSKSFPYLKEKQKEKAISFLQEMFMSAHSKKIRHTIVEVLSNSYVTFSPDELATFFYGAFNNEHDIDLKAVVWKGLAIMKSFCSTDIQDELSPFLLDCYVTLIKELPASKYFEYTSILVKALKQKEIEKNRNVFFQLLKENKEYMSSGSLYLLCLIFDEAQKSELRNLLLELLKGDVHDQLIALENIVFIYDMLENKEQFLEEIFSDIFSIKRQVITSCIIENFSMLREEMQIKIWKLLFSFAKEIYEHYNYSEVFTSQKYSIIESLSHVSCYLPFEQTQELAKFFITILDSDDNQSKFVVCKNLFPLLPYVKEETCRQIQEKIYTLLIARNATPQMLPSLLNNVIFDDFAKNKDFSSMLFWLRQKMNNEPGLLLNSALRFFNELLDTMPEELITAIFSDVFHYVHVPEYFEASASFIINCSEEIPDFYLWAYANMFNPKTYHVSFAAFEIFQDELKTETKLFDNYERIRGKAPYKLALKMADFHYEVGAHERAEELIEWILREAPEHLTKLETYKLKRKWELIQNRGFDANQTLKNMLKLITYGDT